jgi:hypothetical protein
MYDPGIFILLISEKEEAGELSFATDQCSKLLGRLLFFSLVLSNLNPHFL